jgi:hypothetical protein
MSQIASAPPPVPALATNPGRLNRHRTPLKLILAGDIPGEQLPKKKRRKVNHACLYCRRSHMTCDDGRPCQRWYAFYTLYPNCSIGGFNGFCSIKREIGHLCRDEIKQTPSKPADKSTSSPLSGPGSSTEQPTIRTVGPGDSGLPHSKLSRVAFQIPCRLTHLRLGSSSRQLLITPLCPPINPCHLQLWQPPNPGHLLSSPLESIPVRTASEMSSPSSRESQSALLAGYDDAGRIFFSAQRP